MTERERQIVGQVVKALRRGGEPLTEAVIGLYIENFLTPPRVTLFELREVLRFCEEQGWVAGVTDAFGQSRWAITTKGRLADV